MGFKIYSTLIVHIAFAYYVANGEDIRLFKNPNIIGQHTNELYFRVAAKINENDYPGISGNDGMRCPPNSSSYKTFKTAAAALKLNGDCSDGMICYCGDIAGNPCAAQILVDKYYGTEDAFDKRMCNGCIYKLKLLDIFDYDFNSGRERVEVRTDAYLYIQFYKAIDNHSRDIGRGDAYKYDSHIDIIRHPDSEVHSMNVYNNIVKEVESPSILLESRAMLHFFKRYGACIADRGIMVKMGIEICRNYFYVPYPRNNLDFGSCNPLLDGVPNNNCRIDLVKQISRQLFRAYITKTPYECFTNFRLLPIKHFIATDAYEYVSHQAPCYSHFEKDEISENCGIMSNDGSKCIGRFRGVSNVPRIDGNDVLTDDELPRNNCGNCYVVRLWTRSVNPNFRVKKHHYIEMRVKVYGEASYKSSGLGYNDVTSDYRIPGFEKQVFPKEGLNRDVELLWEPVKNGYKYMCKYDNCRLCVDEKVSDGINTSLSDALRKEINITDYSFTMRKVSDDQSAGTPYIEYQGDVIKRPFRHFIHLDGEKYGKLNYTNGQDVDYCGKEFVEWEAVCFMNGSKLRFSVGDECDSNFIKRITKGQNHRGSIDLDAFAATMMLLVGTEDLDGDIAGSCDGCYL